MYNKILEGYNLFIIKKENKDLVGILSLKDIDNGYKDIEQLSDNALDFINKYQTIKNILDEEHALYISYNHEDEQYFVSIRKKDTTGEYNDMIVWNHIVSVKENNLTAALELLNEEVIK